MAGAFLTHSLGRLFSRAVLALALALALVPGLADPASAARTMTNDQIMALVRESFDNAQNTAEEDPQQAGLPQPPPSDQQETTP